eukprot:scaffold748_cov251-Pinguiococcus_pyrenoidosus.AAC.49
MSAAAAAAAAAAHPRRIAGIHHRGFDSLADCRSAPVSRLGYGVGFAVGSGFGFPKTMLKHCLSDFPNRMLSAERPSPTAAG